MALRQQFGGRAEGAYQSLNCCLTALQHKTHLIEKMADKPCEILRPQGERRSTLLRAGAVSEDLSFSCCCCTILLAVVSCISFSLILFFFLNFSIFLCSLFIRRAKNDAQWCQSTITLSASCHEMGEIEWDNRSFLLSHVKRSSKSHNIVMKEVANGFFSHIDSLTYPARELKAVMNCTPFQFEMYLFLTAESWILAVLSCLHPLPTAWLMRLGASDCCEAQHGGAKCVDLLW